MVRLLVFCCRFSQFCRGQVLKAHLRLQFVMYCCVDENPWWRFGQGKSEIHEASAQKFMRAHLIYGEGLKLTLDTLSFWCYSWKFLDMTQTPLTTTPLHVLLKTE